MSRLTDLTTESLRELIGSVALTIGTLAINAASAATFKTTTVITYLVDGVFKSKAGAAAIPFSAGHKTIPTGGYAAFFVVGLDAAGAVTTYQSQRAFLPEVQGDGTTKYRGFDMGMNAGATAAIATYQGQLEDFNAGFLPDVPNGITPVGIIKITNTSVSAGWVPGTSALDLAGTTPVYADISMIPSATNL